MSTKLFMVISYLGDNHLKNLRALFSIFEQDYDGIVLIACNNATDHFKAEKIVYNLNKYRNSNFRNIKLHENRRPISEYLSLQRFCGEFEADYVIMLRDGELLNDCHVLSRLVQSFENSKIAKIIISNTDDYKSGFKKKAFPVLDASDVAALISGSVETQKRWIAKSDQINRCLFAYRIDFLKQIFNEKKFLKDDLHKEICASLLENDCLLIYSEFSGMKLLNMKLNEQWGPFAMDLNDNSIKYYLRVLFNKASRLDRLFAFCILDILLFISASLMIPINTFFLNVMGVIFCFSAYFLFFFNALLIVGKIYLKVKNMGGRNL